MQVSRVAACAIAVLCLAATNANTGFFATLRGGGTADMRGTALFGIIRPVGGGEPGFHIDLYTGKERGDKERIEFYRDQARTLAPGSYPLWDSARDEEQPRDRFRIAVQAAGQGWIGRSGTLAITSVSGGRLSGSFTARVSYQGEDDRTISATVTGTFDAAPEKW